MQCPRVQDILAAGTVDSGMVIPTPECSEIQTERADPVPRLTNGGPPGEEAATSTVSNQYHKVGHKM